MRKLQIHIILDALIFVAGLIFLATQGFNVYAILSLPVIFGFLYGAHGILLLLNYFVFNKSEKYLRTYALLLITISVLGLLLFYQAVGDRSLKIGG